MSKKIVKGELKPMIQKHSEIIDEWFNNGYSGVKSVLSISGDGLSYHGASALFKLIMKAPQNQAYIEAKRNRLKAKADIKNEQVLRELVIWAYSDATDYIGLTIDQIKKLPPEVRRCIQSIKHNKKTFTMPSGVEVEEVNIEVKLIDKTKAIEAISKHIGFYEVDNKQKRTTINLNQLNVNTLNNLVQAMNNNNKAIGSDTRPPIDTE